MEQMLRASRLIRLSEVVEFRITGTIKSFSYAMLDNIRVGSFLNHDLAITSFRVPTEMKAGDGSPVKA